MGPHHPNKRLLLSRPFNHLPELELSSDLEQQCFLEKPICVELIAWCESPPGGR